MSEGIPGRAPRYEEIKKGMEIPIRLVHYNKTEWGQVTGAGNWGFAVRINNTVLHFRWGRLHDDYGKHKLAGVTHV